MKNMRWLETKVPTMKELCTKDLGKAICEER